MIEITFEDKTIFINRAEIESIEFLTVEEKYSNAERKVCDIALRSGRHLTITDITAELTAQLREALA
jgi:hypothetical protein